MIPESDLEAEIKLSYNIFERIVERRYGIKLDPQTVDDALRLIDKICQRLTSAPENLVKEFFQHAEIDYKSAKLLHDSKIYPSMAFHIQQSVEKLAKAYALYLGLIEKEKLQRDVGHESPRAFILILKEKGTIDLVLLIFTILGQRWKSYESVRKNIEDFERLLERRKELARMSKAEIRSLVLKSEEITNRLRKIDPRKIRVEVQRMKLACCVEAKKVGLLAESTDWESNPNRTRAILATLDKLTNPNVARAIFDKLILLVRLYILTIITFPHSFYPRYPYEEMQITDYREGLGIVDCAGELLDTIEEIMKKLKESWGLGTRFIEKREAPAGGE